MSEAAIVGPVAGVSAVEITLAVQPLPAPRVSVTVTIPISAVTVIAPIAVPKSMAEGVLIVRLPDVTESVILVAPVVAKELVLRVSGNIKVDVKKIEIILVRLITGVPIQVKRDFLSTNLLKTTHCRTSNSLKVIND